MLVVKKGSAGKRGNNIRSDCFVEIELTKGKGIRSSLQSKVNSMYGQDINDMIIMMCGFFEIKHAEILVEDNGALPFTIAARFEAAYKKIRPDDSREFFPSMNKNNYYPTQKDRMRSKGGICGYVPSAPKTPLTRRPWQQATVSSQYPARCAGEKRDKPNLRCTIRLWSIISYLSVPVEA